MEVKINQLSSKLFLELYTSVGWDAPCIEQVEKALSNTIATFVAYDGNKPVGMVRMIGDARKAGAKALYISACSSEETIAFYKAMGCGLTNSPIEEIAADEPYDLQMVCVL